MKTKEIKDLSVDYQSESPEDFIEVLNEISPELGGVTNLGVFADIKSVTSGFVLRTKESSEFVSVKTMPAEKPYNYLQNDSSSLEPYDYDFEHLINHSTPVE